MTAQSPEQEGWAALAAWPDGRVGAPVGSGTVSDVRHVTVGGEAAVARWSKRSAADLDWEVDLLEFLGREGLGVPQLLPASDGRLTVGGLIVMRPVEGREPTTRGDWRQLSRYLGRLHELTPSWGRQRPGWCSVAELATRERSGPVDLTSLPGEVVVRCRAAWSRLAGLPRTVIHGDPNPTNVRMVHGALVLLDWDEARIDCPQLDLALLPEAATGIPDGSPAKQALDAWLAAMFWTKAPEYARRRLARVD